MHSVAEVLAPEFERSWHEAVAIVQEVVFQLGDAVALPAPGDLLFNDDGSLSLGFASEESGSPVTALATLLEALIDGADAPVGLRTLVSENTGPRPAHATAASFASALAFYERPARQNDLRAVLGRLEAGATAHNPDVDVERLREKLNVPKQKDAESKGRSHRFSRKQAAAAGVAAVLLAGSAAAVRSPRVSHTGGAIVDAGHRASAWLQAELNSLASPSNAGEPATGDVSPEAEAGTAAPAKPRSGSRPVLEAAADVGNVAAGGSSFRSQGSASASPIPVEGGSFVRDLPHTDLARMPLPVIPLRERPEPAWGEGIPSPRIYGASDTRVKPAILLRQQLPTVPSPTRRTGYFDLVVDEQGVVESVSLDSPTLSYYDKMLVAAAKAWRFAPASLDGQPVRFRVRIPINVTGPR
jgi:hypothetical protein